MFKCEIYNCGKETKKVLCREHEEEVIKEEVQIVMCNRCNHITEVRSREEGKEKYYFIYGCNYCVGMKGDPVKLVPLD